MLSQECSRTFGGTPLSYVRKFNTCVSHTQLASWSSKSDSVGESFIGRVDDLIVFTTKERTRSAPKRRLEENPCESTISTIVGRLGWTRGFRRARRPTQTASMELTSKELDDMRAHVKTLVNATSELPSDSELETALIVSKRAKALTDEQGRAVHTTAQISYNNCTVGNGLLRCPKLVVLIHVPAHVAVNFSSIGQMLGPISSPVDCIYSCELNPLKTVLTQHSTSDKSSSDPSKAFFMTIAVSIPSGVVQ